MHSMSSTLEIVRTPMPLKKLPHRQAPRLPIMEVLTTLARSKNTMFSRVPPRETLPSIRRQPSPLFRGCLGIRMCLPYYM